MLFFKSPELKVVVFRLIGRLKESWKSFQESRSPKMVKRHRTFHVTDVAVRLRHFSDSSFPGLYIMSLRSRCWSADEQRIVLQTFWRSKCELVVIDTHTGHVTRLTDGSQLRASSPLAAAHEFCRLHSQILTWAVGRCWT